jgi:hypothetical protein
MFRSAAFASFIFGVLLISAPAVFAQEIVFCAEENGYCRVPYPTRVIYGAGGGRSASQYVSGRGIACSNRVFGDPAPGAKKTCSYVAGRGERYDDDRRRWRTCANEDGFCEFRGQRRVRFGRQGQFVEETFRNGTPCSSNAFGTDPAPGVRKMCQILD